VTATVTRNVRLYCAIPGTSVLFLRKQEVHALPLFRSAVEPQIRLYLCSRWTSVSTWIRCNVLPALPVIWDYWQF